MKGILLFLIILLPHIVLSQTFQVYSITQKNFPNISANFYCFNTEGKQITNFSINDFEVYENGEKRKVLSVWCPQPKEPVPLSSVLVVDVSGSMGGGQGNVPNIELAKEGARIWVNTLPLGKSECAITAFDSYNYLIQDFTIEKTKLLEGIDKLTPKGGTDYNMAFINPPAGGLLVAKNGTNKLVVVFLSDGMPNQEPKTEQIVQMAKQNNVTIFAVILGMNCPESIKKITSETGGFWFENVNSLEKIREIYQHISYVAQNNEPCTIEWESKPICPNEPINVSVRLLKYGLFSQSQYLPLEGQIAQLKLEPSFIIFKNKEINKIHDTTIKITAINSDFVISNITSTDPNYVVTPNSFTIKKGETKLLTVKHRPTDSVYSFATFKIEGTPCESKFFVYGTYRKYSKNTSKLRVTHPNGGEVFVVGSDTVITWEGIPPVEAVSLEYSTDGGTTWKFIDTASGLSYKWKNIPKPASNRCLVRVTKLDRTFNPIATTIPLGHLVRWSPDGNLIATTGGNSIALLDAKTLDTVRILSGQHDFIYSMNFNKIGNLLVSCELDEIALWEIPTGNLTFKLSHSLGTRTSSVAISPDNKFLAFTLDNNITIWDIAKNIESFTIENTSPTFVFADFVNFSPDGNILVYHLQHDYIFLYDFQNKFLITQILGTLDNSSVQIFTKDGKYLAYKAANTIKIFEMTSKETIKDFKVTSFIRCYALSPNGKYLAIGLNNDIKVFDVEIEKEIASFTIDNLVQGLAFSPDENILAYITPSKIALLDLNKSKEIAFKRGHFYSIFAIAISPDLKSIVSNCQGEILFWDRNANFIKGINAHSDYIYSFAFSPDGKYITSASWDRSVKIWNLDNNSLHKSINASSWPISVDHSPDGKHLAISWEDGTVQLLVNPLDNNTTTIGIKENEDFRDIKFSPNSNMLVGVSEKGEIKAWQLPDLKTLWSKKPSNAKSSYAYSLSISPDGLTIAVSYIDEIKLFLANNGEEIATIPAQGEMIKSITYNHDGTLLAAGHYNGPICIWETNTYSLIKKIYAHNGDVNRVQFSPNDDYLVSCGKDAMLKIWPLELTQPQQDVSDSLFSIVEPSALAKDIDLGICFVNDIKDSLVKEFFFNTGKWTIRVDSIYFEGPDALAFSLVSGFPKYFVAPGFYHSAEFRFAPKRIGLHTANIIIITQADTLQYRIRGEGVENTIAIDNPIIDFGKVLLGQSKDTIQVATISNIGASPITIFEVNIGFPNDKDFFILDGGGSFTLQPGETKKMDLRFSPSDVGRTSSSLVFHYAGAKSPAVVQLFGEGAFAGTALARLRTLELQGFPGDTILVPIILDTAANLILAGIRNIDVDLYFNPTILIPLHLNAEIIDEKTAKVRVASLPVNKKSGDTLKEIPFFVALGNSTHCPLTLSNAETHGGYADITLVSGWFKLLGLCFEGGARLVNPNSKSGILNFYPNPSENLLEINISLTEVGLTRLILFNSLGEIVTILFEQIIPRPTTISTKFNTMDLAPGQYILQLATPSFVQNEIICIFR